VQPGTDVTAEDVASTWELRDMTLTVLATELCRRYKSLQRSWRSQKLEISMETQYFAGDFFRGWYLEVRGATAVPREPQFMQHVPSPRRKHHIGSRACRA
jgi:hypothetical protein